MAGLVRFADAESSRYALSGVAVEGESLIATDGRRLTHRIALGSGENDGGLVIVPSATASLAGRLFAQEGAVDVYTDGNKITYHGLFAKLTGRLAEGRFPKWADVIPDFAKLPHAKVNVAALTAALRGSQVTTTAESKAVDLRFTPKDDTLSITSISAEIGESDVTCGLAECSIDGTMSLDPQYLLNVLELCPGDDSVELFTDLKGALVVRHEQQNITAVIMPMSKEGQS
jgi:DNA polymerase-3 subunit beta